MALLLYKSKEMFSTTELIRKSKMIFDKIVDNEIDKAIIMRDGKPGFLLMDFEKYESIMEEYENLKLEYEKLTSSKNKRKKESKDIKIKPKKPKDIKKEFFKEDDKEVLTPSEKPKETIPEVLEEKKIEEEKSESIVSRATHSSIVETVETKEEKKAKLLSQIPQVTQEEVEDIKDIKKDLSPTKEDLDEATELKEALGKIKNLNFSEEEKQKVEAQIKQRIQKAREERAKLLEEENKLDKEDLKEELKLQVQLKKEKKKKDEELSEFWN